LGLILIGHTLIQILWMTTTYYYQEHLSTI